MENLYFYPTLNDDLLEASGCNISQYGFSYLFDGEYRDLKTKGKSTVKLEDSWESWKIETDGLHIKREITFEYPEALYGKNGIACKDAELGLSIIWTNKTLTQMGTILPASVTKSGTLTKILFEHDFYPGEIQGDLELETILYIKVSAKTISEEEAHLMNEAGVNVGVLDEVKLDFGSMYMDFPIQEVNSKQQPLWWLNIGSWSDPTQDLFNEDNLCLFLNSAYDCCPKVGETIKNSDVLVDIIATAYTMIFQKITEMDCLNKTINDVNLEPGSICKIMFYFWSGCDTPVDFSSVERMHRSIWMNVAAMINGGDEE